VRVASRTGTRDTDQLKDALSFLYRL